MLSAIVQARGSGLRKGLTAQHISYVGGKLLRNRAILIKLVGLEQRTPEPVLSFSTILSEETFPSSHLEHGGRAGAIHRRCRESQRKKIRRKNRYGRTNYRLVAIPKPWGKGIDL